MADLADIQLDKELETPGPARRRRRLLIIAVTLAAAGALVWYATVWFQRSSASNVRLETAQAVVPAEGSTRPRAEVGENIPLPPLGDTDSLVRDLVRRLSSHPKVAAWLATDQLIRNFTVSVINIADGQSPARHLRHVPPTGTFRASGADGSGFIDQQSYSRYDDYADAVAALDPRGAAQLYATLRPRIDEAARELGQPHGNFDVTLERAIVELLRTPVVEGRIAVTASPVLWEYSDPRLASLSGAQRQMLRMGPRNVRVIQEKLREISLYLGIAPARLPAPSVIHSRGQ